MRRALLFFISIFGFSMLAEAQSLCVQKSVALLRSAPNNTAPVSWKAPKYMPLQPTGTQSGSWFQVADVDGQKHWVNNRDISTKMSCLVVKVKKTRLRLGPGSDFDPAPAGVADRYSSFLDLGGEDGWTQVEDELGQKAWVNLDHTWKSRQKLRMSFQGD